MPTIENPRHEAFAQRCAEGMSATQAYRLEVSAKCTVNSAMQAASRLLADVKVRSRVVELRKDAETVLLEQLAFSKATLLRYYVEVLETPIGDIDEKHRLAQEVSYSERGKRVKMPNKMEAAKQIATLAGWCEGEGQPDQARDTLLEFFDSIRKPGIPREPCADPSSLRDQPTETSKFAELMSGHPSLVARC